MKIVSQLSNSISEITNKPAPVDPSMNSFQTTLANVSGVAQLVVKEPGLNLGKPQGGETKKASNPEERKKSDSPKVGDQTITPQAAGDIVQLMPVSSVPPGGDLLNTLVQTGAPASLMGFAAASSASSDAAEFGALSRQPSPPATTLAPDNSSIDRALADKPGAESTEAGVSQVQPVLLPFSSAIHEAPDALPITAPIKVDGATRPEATPAAASGAQSDSSEKRASPAQAPPAASVALPPIGSQQEITQDTNPSVISSTPNFISPAAKAGIPAVGGVAAGSVTTKGKAVSSRISGAADEKQAAFSRPFGVADEKQAERGTDGDSSKPRVEASTVIEKDIPGATKEMAQPPVTAQTTAIAQVDGPAAIVQAPHGVAQNTSTATGPSASTFATSVETVQSAHAMTGAQLIQSAHGSEMRLGMQSAEFGNISINTSLNRQALSAQISIDHAALGHALAAHLPAIQEKLGSAYGVHAKVELRDTGANSSLNGSSSRESKGSRQSRSGEGSALTAGLQGNPRVLTSSTYTSPTGSASRLDIRI